GLTSGGASATSVGGTHFEMDGDPIQGLLSLAVKTVTEAAKAEAEQALKQLDKAVEAKVDQVMGPINQVQQQAERVKAGMDAVSNGDLSGAADAFGAAAGMPGPEKFAADLDRGRGEVAGGGVSQKFGLDALAKGAIQKGGDALGEALGV